MPDPTLPDSPHDDAPSERRRQHMRLYLAAMMLVLLVVAIIQLFVR